MVQIKSKTIVPSASLTYVWLILVPVAALLAFFAPVGRLIVGGVLVLVVPGFLLWQILGRDLHLPRLAAPAIWIALSLSVVPLVFLWASTLGVPLMPVVLQVVFALLGLLALWVVVSRRAARHSSLAPRGYPRHSSLIRLWIGYAGLFGLVLLTRALHIRGFTAPLWVDSVHHTLLVRIIGETGRIPLSLEPYQPITDLPYHGGYHTVAAAWRGVSGLPLVESVLWSGQVLNALIMPTMYALGAYLLRSPRAGLLAAGCAGLVSLLPAYYVTWGRYTQLTGLLVLAVLLLVTTILLERPRTSWCLLVLVALLLAGLFLIHYRVLIFYAAFLLPYSVLLVARRPRQAGAIVLRGAILGGMLLVLVAPWAWLLVRRIVVPLASVPRSLASTDSYNSFDWNLLLAGNNRALFIVAGVGGALALLQWRWRVLALAGWIGTMLLIANPQILGLPPAWLINNHAVIITLFMPASLLAAYAVNTALVFAKQFVIERSALSVQRSAFNLFILQPLAFCLFGWAAWDMRSVVNTQTILATHADMRAIDWVAANTPADARFLTNSTPWLNSAPRGTDGGYWLLPLAQRFTTTPTALYEYGSPADKQHIDEVNRRVAALNGDRGALHDLVRSEAIDYVFIGANGGPMSAQLVRDDPFFVPVYEQDGVLIMAVRPVS